MSAPSLTPPPSSPAGSGGPGSKPGGPGGPGGPPPGPPFNAQLALGLLGILLAAIVAGVNNRVPGLVQADLRGALGLEADAASWINSAYAAGELVAMPFATWFAITFSLRRFHLSMLGALLVLALLMPSLHTVPLLVAARAVQGVCAGALIPLLMMAALRFLPPPIRLHGLALYALTATLAPNVAVWLAALCVDTLADWRWAYWLVIPPGLLAMALVAWGVPRMPLALPRLQQGNWLGMALGVLGLGLLAVALDQGVRLQWGHSALIRAALLLGGVLTALFLLSEWRHPAPFMRLQLLGRRNLGLGFSIFFGLLLTMSTGVALPLNALAHGLGLRMAQLAPLGLGVGLPQLLLGPLVALLLYQRWVDARALFALGLGLIGLACYLGAQVDAHWMVPQFYAATLCHALGQPLAVVSLLFLGTSVVAPMEGPSVAGIINTLRALGTLCSGALVGEWMSQRSALHAERLLDQASLWPQSQTLPAGDWAALAGAIAEQAAVLATADVYRFLGLLAVLLIAPVLCLQRIHAPSVPSPSPAPAIPTP
jgi:DHA2 family multidrug resistance protein